MFQFTAMLNSRTRSMSMELYQCSVECSYSLIPNPRREKNNKKNKKKEQKLYCHHCTDSTKLSTSFPGSSGLKCHTRYPFCQRTPLHCEKRVQRRRHTLSPLTLLTVDLGDEVCQFYSSSEALSDRYIRLAGRGTCPDQNRRREPTESSLPVP